jgi:arsenite-transporting ATPase
MSADTTTPFFLHDPGLRLLLFGGKGGVGKTTCATATALCLARSFPQSPFLLVSTDPAHSLVDSLAGFPPPHNLEPLELDAKESVAIFKKNYNEKLRAIASHGTLLDGEDIGQLLDLSLPGLDELMAFLDISRWVEEGSYHCIIVDTAPTGHTLRLLAMPELIRKWLKALDALLAKHRYMKLLFHVSYHQDELDEFLLGMSASVNRMETLLRDPVRCRFVPVMLAEELSIRETLMLLGELERLRIPSSDIVVNRLFPQNLCPVCGNERSYQMRELWLHSQKLSEYALWGVPLYSKEIRGLWSLEAFWEGASAVSAPPCEMHQADPKPLLSPFRIEGAGDLPSPETRLLLFAGKGGVGKTTLACATALRLARDFSGKEVLLFSMDPAHSLSACLDVPIGPEPTRVASGLTAMEINAQAEFEVFRNQYTEDLERFLGVISPNLDLAFDHEVMERIMDLSPPGLDEVMTLTRVMGFLAQDQYDVFILDSAPTGHLLRLLELPELIDQWLKAFFNLFLKYKRVFRLPVISQRLVQMSKELKHLRSLLGDPERAALFAVTIPTEMAFEETKDLVASCERIGISVPMLFINLAAPPSRCPLCAALHERESKLKRLFQETFSGSRHVLIYRHGEPRGLQQLGIMGKALYQPARRVLCGANSIALGTVQT